VNYPFKVLSSHKN